MSEPLLMMIFFLNCRSLQGNAVLSAYPSIPAISVQTPDISWRKDEKALFT